MIKKRTLVVFPFHKLNSMVLDKESLKPFRQEAGWLLPQLMAWMGSTLQLRKNSDGLFSPKYLVEDNLSLAAENKLLYEGRVVPAPVLAGMFKVLAHYPRGDILNPTTQKQTKPEGIRFNAGVPLVFSAFKEYRNIPYSMWDWWEPELEQVVDKGIVDLARYFGDEQVWTAWKPEELIQIREQANAKDVPLTSLYSIVVCSDMEFKKLPRLLKTLLCQTWVYHPSCRDKYTITHLLDLDNPPEPLVGSELKTATSLFSEYKNQDVGDWGQGYTLGSKIRKLDPKVADVDWG